MDKSNKKELGLVCSNNSILVINKGGIYRLLCPFKAVCIQKIHSYVIGQEVTVIAVEMSQDYKLVYIIQDKGYYYHYFVIISESKVARSTFN